MFENRLNTRASLRIYIISTVAQVSLYRIALSYQSQLFVIASMRFKYSIDEEKKKKKQIVNSKQL